MKYINWKKPRYDWANFGTNRITWAYWTMQAGSKPVILYGKGPTFNADFDQGQVKDHFQVCINETVEFVKRPDLVITIDYGIRTRLVDVGFKNIMIGAVRQDWVESWDRDIAGSGDFALRVLGEMGCRLIYHRGFDLEGENGFPYHNKSDSGHARMNAIKKQIELTKAHYGITLEKLCT